MQANRLGKRGLPVFEKEKVNEPQASVMQAQSHIRKLLTDNVRNLSP
jgi:hypothetical protein